MVELASMILELLAFSTVALALLGLMLVAWSDDQCVDEENPDS